MIINISCNFDMLTGISFNEEKFENIAKTIVKNIISSDIITLSPLSNYNLEKEISIDILLTDNKKIHNINKEFRKKDTPTDVITFALFVDTPPEFRMLPPDEIPLGEIIISLEKIKEQAVQNNKSFEAELNFILAHGILHLFGFDHLTDKDLEIMIDMQNKLVEMIDV